MFLKLLKADFKRYSRSFIPVVVCIFFASFALIFSSNMRIKSLDLLKFNTSLFVEMLSLGILVAGCVWTLINFIKIFNEKFISTQSYLTFSLPVKRQNHFSSNLIVAICWGFLVLVLLFGAIFIVYYWRNDLSAMFSHIYYMLRDSRFARETLFSLFEFFSVMLFELILIYFCILIVNISQLKNSPRLFGIMLFGLISYVIADFLSHIYMLIYNMFDFDCLNYFNGSWIMGIEFLIAAGLCYCGCVYILNNKLEVD